jgi:hypothetical protein
MLIASEPTCFFAEAGCDGQIFGLWGDETGEVTMVCLDDDLGPQGVFFTISPSTIHELATYFQACEHWLRSEGHFSGAKHGQVDSSGCGNNGS